MLGQNLKKLREVRKIAQKNLADMLGVGTSTLSGWETGYRTPDLEMLIKLADFYDVSVDSLLGRRNLDVKVDIESDQLKYKSDVEKLRDNVIHLLDQALIDGILTEAQAKITLQTCQHIMVLMISANQEK